MKLSPESIAYLDKILSTCAIAGIDAIIIDADGVRGINENKTCVIISQTQIPKLPELYKMGLTRLNVLTNRLSLFKSDPQISVEAKENEQRTEISSLEVSSPSAKVQFRCTSSSLIKAPKKINDTAKFVLTINKEQVPFILSGAKSMSAKFAILAGKKDGVFFEFTDSNQDTFSTKVAESNDLIFANCYAAEVLLPLIKSAAANLSDSENVISIEIGEIGTAQLMINGYALTVLPQIQE